MFESIRELFWDYPDKANDLWDRYSLLLGLLIIAPLLFLLFYWMHSTIWYGSRAKAQAKEVYVEGMIGEVNRLNPLLASQDQNEKDVQRLIFNRLVRVGSSGDIFSELAETWTVSEDGKEYIFFLTKEAQWHDGVKFTAKDVIYTFDLIKGKSEVGELGTILKKVTVKQIDDYTVSFRLKEKNITFLELAAVNIVPEHILSNLTWRQIKVGQFNENPIGTGPYKVVKATEQQYDLEANQDYFLGQPSLPKIRFILYPDEEQALDAIKAGHVQVVSNITATGVQELEEYKNIGSRSAVFYNRTRLLYINLTKPNPNLSRNIRQALQYGLDKREFTKLLEGTKAASGPISELSWAYDETLKNDFGYNPGKADALLRKDKWIFPKDKVNPDFREQEGKFLVLTLTYMDNKINEKVARKLEEQFESLGIKLILDPRDFNSISQEVIPNRDFEILLFEVETKLDPDKYTLWHSSQKEYPGLNIVGYNNNRVDYLLQQGRLLTNKGERAQAYYSFQRYIMDDVPALFLYHPAYYLVYDKKLINIPDLEGIVDPSDRFERIVNEWDNQE